LKHVIINADDMGWSAAVNRGIVEAFENGVLTSTTLLINGPACGDAVERVRLRPALGVGLHLNLLRGRPVLPAARLGRLVDGRGLFVCSVPRLFAAALFSLAARACMEAELSAQIERALAAGVPLTHLDSEKHVHFFPPINRIVVRLARRYGIKALRHARRWGAQLCSRPGVAGGGRARLKERLLLVFSGLNSRGIYRSGLRSPDRIFGVAESGKLTAGVLERILAVIPDGISEIVCHPGFAERGKVEADGLLGRTYIDRFRELELEGLLSPRPREVAGELGIELINYGDLGGTSA